MCMFIYYLQIMKKSSSKIEKILDYFPDEFPSPTRVDEYNHHLQMNERFIVTWDSTKRLFFFCSRRSLVFGSIKLYVNFYYFTKIPNVQLTDRLFSL